MGKAKKLKPKDQAAKSASQQLLQEVSSLFGPTSTMSISASPRENSVPPTETVPETTISTNLNSTATSPPPTTFDVDHSPDPYTPMP